MQFENYKKLIQKRAWFYSKKYKVPYKEVEAQGFLIYCQSVKKYDFTKSTFCTFLYSELSRLSGYCRTYIRISGVLLDEKFGKNAEYKIKSKNSAVTCEQLLEDASLELSEQALDCLKYIVKREWEFTSVKKKFSVQMVMNYFGWCRKKANRVFAEIKNYWNNEGYLLYV